MRLILMEQVTYGSVQNALTDVVYTESTGMMSVAERDSSIEFIWVRHIIDHFRDHLGDISGALGAIRAR